MYMWQSVGSPALAVSSGGISQVPGGSGHIIGAIRCGSGSCIVSAANGNIISANGRGNGSHGVLAAVATTLALMAAEVALPQKVSNLTTPTMSEPLFSSHMPTFTRLRGLAAAASSGAPAHPAPATMGCA